MEIDQIRRCGFEATNYVPPQGVDARYDRLLKRRPGGPIPKRVSPTRKGWGTIPE